MKKQEFSGELPKEVLRLMEKSGIKTDDFCYAVTGDMDPEGGYKSCWIAFDREGLYLALGEETLVKVKGSRRLRADYRIDEVRSIPLEEIDKLKTE